VNLHLDDKNLPPARTSSFRFISKYYFDIHDPLKPSGSQKICELVWLRSKTAAGIISWTIFPLPRLFYIGLLLIPQRASV
jgi:hypothetical protein